jgi:hypothetical protein
MNERQLTNLYPRDLAACDPCGCKTAITLPTNHQLIACTVQDDSDHNDSIETTIPTMVAARYRFHVRSGVNRSNFYCLASREKFANQINW